MALDGLLTSVDGAVRRLHPLLREHYVRRLAAEVPVRKQRLHRGIADALARRGHMIPAWRHASETGDRRFLGEMMERVGVFRMWLREGKTCLAAADRFLTPVLSEQFPRLAVIRCVARRLRLEFDEARTLFQATKPKLGPGASRCTAPPAAGVRRGTHTVRLPEVTAGDRGGPDFARTRADDSCDLESCAGNIC